MISHHIFYQMVLLGLLWLFIMLHVIWPSDQPAPAPKLPQPVPPSRTRSKEPKPFVGLPRQPHCDACAQASEAPTLSPSPVLPPTITSTRGRRHIDTSHHFCPHPGCAYGGWLGLGNLSANGHPNGGPWRQLYCSHCGGYFLETHGTIFHGKRVSVDLIVHVIGCLAEGLGIRSTARVFEVDPNTVLAVAGGGRRPATGVFALLLHDLHVTQVQLDELYALLSAIKTGTLREGEAIERLERSPHWVWVAMDPESKLLLTIDVGKRTLAMAQGVVHQGAQILAPDCVPLFLTDGFKVYMSALLTHYGRWVQSPRRHAPGPAPRPRWMPLPGLLYAQVVKTVRRRRLVRVSHRVVFGTLDAVNQVLAPYGWQINTAFVERLNLDIRQHVAAIGRRVITLCKDEDGLAPAIDLVSRRTITSVCRTPPYASRCRSPCPPMDGLGQAVAAPDAGDGGGVDGPCLEHARSPALSRAAVAAASRGVSKPSWWKVARGGGLRRRRASTWPAVEGFTRAQRAAVRP